MACDVIRPLAFTQEYRMGGKNLREEEVKIFE